VCGNPKFIAIGMKSRSSTEAMREPPIGEPCCEPVVYPHVEREQAQRMAPIAKALGDPVRLQLVDVLLKHAGKVCVCELVPLFDLSQPTVSHHLKVVREAGIVGSERHGLRATTT
jgi:ArsR family transcriptional regulator